MEENAKQNDEIIDFEELDELPDIVLGEKTRAMRILREENNKTQPRRKQSSALNKKLDKVDVYDQTTGLPSVDDLLHEDIKVNVDSHKSNSNSLEETRVINSLNEVKEDFDKNDSTPLESTKVIGTLSDDIQIQPLQHESIADEIPVDESELSSLQKFKTGTFIDYRGNKVEIEDFNAKTQRYKIFDSGRIKWVTEKSLKLIDPEIPESLQDDDPGIDDELSTVFKEHDEVKQQDGSNNSLNHRASNDLNVIYDDTSATSSEDSKSSLKTAKHAKQSNDFIQDKSKLSADNDIHKKHDAIPFNEVYQDTYDSVYHTETLKEKAIREKRRNTTPMKQKIITGIIIILLLLLSVGVYTIYSGAQPVTSTSEEVAFEIVEGSTARDVANQLQEEGIIKNADVAYTYARIFNLTDVKQGLFTLDKSWDIKQMWTYLNDQNAARKDETLVTIIEGDWAKDAASKFSEVTNVSADDLLALWNNKEWIESQKDKYPFITDDMFKDGVRIYLEGYLAPNSYYIPKDTTAEEITTTLLDQTLTVYNKYADEISNTGHSIAEIYTMASIIQYEAGTNPDDLAKVASVFYNRLNQGMALQSSVTVCYAIDFDKLEDNWQSCEINSEFESPYNTYKYTGLTPGPIENAGEAALEAAIHPADTSYLYFMAEVCDGQDGTVHYAETLNEHNANVAKYLTCY